MNSVPEKSSADINYRKGSTLYPFRNTGSDGLTLIELIIVIAIIGILSSLGYSIYAGQIKSARTNVVIQDIKALSLKVIEYHSYMGEYPESLEEAAVDTWTDPWGNPYQYTRIKGAAGLGGMRKDRFLVPLNSDFDLYSMGPDGQSKPPLTAAVSKDDIIRANDGQFVGPAYAY